jgi:hypothetical protein
LGRKVKFIRRKREARCFNPKEFMEKKVLDACPCTEDDFECDYGFFKKNATQFVCEPINDQYAKKIDTEAP